MTFDVETKDCTALSDAELGEMADICTDGPAGFGRSPSDRRLDLPDSSLGCIGDHGPPRAPRLHARALNAVWGRPATR